AAPGDGRDEPAADERADEERDPGPGGPGPDRGAALLALEEHRDRCEGRGREQRSGHALGRARGDQRALVPRDRAQHRRDCERDDPDHEHPPLPEEVPERPADKDQRAQREQARVDSPLLEREAAAEVALHRGQRDVHDGRAAEQDRRPEDAGRERQPLAHPYAQIADTSSHHSANARKEADMPGYTVTRLEEVDDVLGDYPGEMRMLAGGLESEQVALTYRRMPQHTGGKGSYGHRHAEQEEIYFVISGKLQFKLENDVIEAGRGTAIRVAPQGFRSVWNNEPEQPRPVVLSTPVP